MKSLALALPGVLAVLVAALIGLTMFTQGHPLPIYVAFESWAMTSVWHVFELIFAVLVIGGVAVERLYWSGK